MRRLLCALLAALVISSVVGVQPAAATTQPEKKLATTLAELWKTVLETPAAENPFTGGDRCVDLGGRVVAPFGSLDTGPMTCAVNPGTKIFVTAVTWECSTVEPEPSYGADEAELRTCAQDGLKAFSTQSITVDGQSVRVRRVETALIPLHLPADNILTGTAENAFSVADGWVALLQPLTPGTHHVVIHFRETRSDGTAVDVTNPTTIIVKRGR